jgi:hypothetical protein
MIVMRVADNHFGLDGGEQHISIALRELTGLQRLNLSGTWFHDFGREGGKGGWVACCVGGGDTDGMFGQLFMMRRLRIAVYDCDACCS